MRNPLTPNLKAYLAQQESARFVKIQHTWELYAETGTTLYFFSEECARFWLDVLTNAFGDGWNIRPAPPLTIH